MRPVVKSRRSVPGAVMMAMPTPDLPDPEAIMRMIAQNVDLGPFHNVDTQFLALLGAVGGAVLIGSLIALFIIKV